MDSDSEHSFDVLDCGYEALDFNFDNFDYMEVSSSMKNPGVPFLHRLKQPLCANNNFILEGTLFDNANQFSVDLCSHTISNRDNVMMKNIAFHFNPRLPLNCIVRNSYIEYAWGEEERRTFKRCPLKRGARFILEIFVAPKEYLVAVNGGHFCSFSHKLPFVDVNTLEIQGDIILNKVELISSKYFPSTISNDVERPILEVPYSQTLTKSISLPFTAVIEGQVYLLPFGFHFNLQSGSHVYPHPLIAFHISVRWRPSDEDVIIFNSWTNDKWDKEVVLPMCDFFLPGGDFRLKIIIIDSGFLVVMNSFTLPLFPHRMNAKLIDTLVIQGDVTISNVEFNATG